MLKKIKKKHIVITSILFGIISLFMFGTIAYSAINSTAIITGDAYARVETDVRITDFRLASTNNAFSSFEEFGKNHIITGVEFANSSSSITYYVEITNYGSTNIGIYDITGLPNGISYSIKDYNLHDKICDDSGKCNNYAKKTLEIILTSTNNYTGNIQLNFEFRNVYSITYVGITDNDYISSIMNVENLNVTFISDIPNRINIYVDGSEIDRSTYVYDNITGNLILHNVIGNLTIEKAESTLIDGRDFSAKIKNFVNDSTEYVYNSTETTVMSIEIYEVEIPNGYTSDTFFKLPSVDVSNNGRVKAYHDNGKVYIYSIDDILAPRDSYSLFRGYSNLTKLNIKELDTKKIYDMGAMFQDLISLEYLDISHFSFGTEVRLFYSFTNMKAVKKIDLPSFKNVKINNIQHVFSDCQNLVSLDLSDWDTSSITLMSSAFANCYSLTSLNLNGWNTSKVVDMSYMFRYNKKLTTLDISSFDTHNVINMDRMFGYCDKLENIYVGDWWDTTIVSQSESMFSNSPKLPNFNADVIDVTNAYAGPGGYLTHINSSTLDNIINTIGGEVCVGNECFYVINHEGTTVRLLAKYNLYVGGQYNVTTNVWTEYDSKATGRQDSTMKAYTSTDSLYDGTIAFSSNNYWNGTIETYPCEIYNSNSVLYTYLINYKSYLETFNIVVKDSRLLTYQELNKLGYSADKKFNNVPEWIYSSSYWLGSASSDELVYAVSSYPALNERTFAYVNSYGLRPVIEINVNELYKIYQ